MWVNFEQLKIFIAVVEHKSFTKAAESLYISHSTTSRNVASLEETLEVRLLNRDNRSVSLTPAGEILFREGAKLLKKVEAIESSVRGAGKGMSGKVSVASVNLYSQSLYSGYQNFCRQYPEIILGMYHLDTHDIWKQVNSGEADIGVTFSYALPRVPGDFELRTVASERFCLVAPVEHPLALKKTVKKADLRRASYISLPSSGYSFTEKVQLENGSRPDSKAAVVPTIESLFLQIRSGNGVSLVPYPIAYEYGANCAILEVEDMDTSFDVVMIWRRDNINPSLPPLIDSLLSYIKRD